ncbi:MAG: FUSC family protein [Culicoidibacterales bacterium]
MLEKLDYRVREMLPLRVIKTSLSVFLAAVIAELLYFDNIFFAGLGAVKSMGFSVQESFETMKNQIIANASAAAVSIAVVFTIGISPFSAAVGIFIILSALNFFRLKGTQVMAGITLCSIILGSDTTALVLERAYERFMLMTIGLIVSFLVNILIFRPNYQIKVDEYLQGLVQKTTTFFENAQQGILDQQLLQAIKKEYQLLQRYVFAAKSDEQIAERFRYEHVQQLSGLEVYLVETDIKIKLLDRLSKLDWVEPHVYRDLQQLFAIEVIVEQGLIEAKGNHEPDAEVPVGFQAAYEHLFAYFQPYIQYNGQHAQEAIRILDLITMYKIKTEQLFTMIADEQGEKK